MRCEKVSKPCTLFTVMATVLTYIHERQMYTFRLTPVFTPLSPLDTLLAARDTARHVSTPLESLLSAAFSVSFTSQQPITRAGCCRRAESRAEYPLRAASTTPIAVFMLNTTCWLLSFTYPARPLCVRASIKCNNVSRPLVRAANVLLLTCVLPAAIPLHVFSHVMNHVMADVDVLNGAAGHQLTP